MTDRRQGDHGKSIASDRGALGEPGIGATFGMLVLLLIALGIGEGLAAATLPESVSATSRMLLALCLAWPLVLFAAYRLNRRSLRNTFGLHAVSAAVLALTVLAAITMAVTLLGMVTWIPTPPPESVAEYHDTMSAANRTALLLAMLIVAPVFEELFFRGWMLPIWVNRYGPAVGIVVVALLFSLLHLAGWKILVAFPIGLLLGWLAVRLESVLPAILGHAASNAGPFALDAALRISGLSKAEIEALDSVPLWIPVIMFAVGAAALIGLVKLTKRDRSPD